MHLRETNVIKEKFSNVIGFMDANMDMDLDLNFHESVQMFHDKLGIPKKDDDAPESDDDK